MKRFVQTMAGAAALALATVSAPASADLSDLGPTTPLELGIDNLRLFEQYGTLTFDGAGFASLIVPQNFANLNAFSYLGRIVTAAPAQFQARMSYNLIQFCTAGCSKPDALSFLSPDYFNYTVAFPSNTVPANELVFGVGVKPYIYSFGTPAGWRGQVGGIIDTVTFTVSGQPGTSTDYYVSFASIPEPTSWAMMMIGFGAIGAAMRRKVRLAPRPA